MTKVQEEEKIKLEENTLLLNYKSHQISHFVNCIRLILERPLKIIYSNPKLYRKGSDFTEVTYLVGNKTIISILIKIVLMKSSHSIIKLI